MKRLLVVIVLMSPSGVHADIYTWKDSRGISHYTNKEYEIPEHYKAKAKPLNIEAVQSGSTSTSQQAAPSQPQPQTQEKTVNPPPAPSSPAPQPTVSMTAPQTPVSGRTPLRVKRRIRSGNDE